MPDRLADFVEANRRAIVDRAARMAAASAHGSPQPSEEQLREHLPQILDAIVKDLRVIQDRTASERRSQTPVHASSTPGTAAGAYARLRAQSGFTLDEVVSEFRALRTSVLHLWSDASPPGEHALHDMTRFNEAMDQILAESIAHFSSEIEGWRDVFLGTLAHDLRGPLSVNVLTAEVLSRITPEGPARLLVERMQRSGARMKQLLDDLLDYSKTSLGRGIRISASPVDLEPELRDEIDLLRVLLPGHAIFYESRGCTSGRFDASRIREALANLVINAAKHGAQGGAIHVTLEGDDAGTALSVRNTGPDIPDHLLATLFLPLGQMRDVEHHSHEADSLGLGLFIVKQIAVAHHGSVAATSRDGCTDITMRLPRGAM